MAKRKVKSSSRLFAVTLFPRTCKYSFDSGTCIDQNLAPWLKKNHQNSTFSNSQRPHPFTRPRTGIKFSEKYPNSEYHRGRLGGPVYTVSGTRDNPSPGDNFTERLFGVVSYNSCPLLHTGLSRDSWASYILDKMAGSGNNLTHLASGRRAKVFIWEKVAPPDRVTLPAETRQLAHPSCLAPPRRVRVLMQYVNS